jgi:predicted anti-sigma-YlaC factor YlaD
MKEETILRKLSAYMDGEVSEDDRGRIDAHIDHCPECRKRLDQMKEDWERLSALPAKQAPPFFYTRMHGRLHTVQVRMKFTEKVLVPLSFAGALYLGVVIGSLVGDRSSAALSAPLPEKPITQAYIEENLNEIPEATLDQIYLELALNAPPNEE